MMDTMCYACLYNDYAESLTAFSDEATGSRIVELCGRYIYSIGKSKDKNYRLRSVVDL